MIPSEYSREYQTAHAALKQDFDSTLNLTIKDNSSVESKSVIKCEKCNSKKFLNHKIFLEMVRKSPRKLVFTISSLIVNCANCGQKRAIIHPTPLNFKQLPNITDHLKEELRSHINQNHYCNQCNEYYENVKTCPKHPSISLTPPKLVFIRGINQQYATSKLLHE